MHTTTPHLSESLISLQPSVLVPEVTVTPECQVLVEGQHNFWAAIEISTKLNTASTCNEISGGKIILPESNARNQLWDVTSGNNMP